MIIIFVRGHGFERLCYVFNLIFSFNFANEAKRPLSYRQHFGNTSCRIVLHLKLKRAMLCIYIYIYISI